MKLEDMELKDLEELRKNLLIFDFRELEELRKLIMSKVNLKGSEA